jgi:hypothetical protein
MELLIERRFRSDGNSIYIWQLVFYSREDREREIASLYYRDRSEYLNNKGTLQQ